MKAHWKIGILLFGLSLTVRLFQIASQSYWNDEFVSVYFSTRASWDAITWDNHPFLYHFLLKVWIYFWGPYEFSTRLLSALFSSLTSFIVFLTVQKNVSTKTAWVAAGLHIIHSFSIQYAQETRMYSLFELTAAIQLYYFSSYYLKKEKCFHWLAASTLLMTMVHYISYLLIIIQAVLIFKRKIRSATHFWIISLIAFITALAASYYFSFSWIHLEWQKLRFQLDPNSQLPFSVLQDLFLGSTPGFWFSALLIFVALVFLFRLHQDTQFAFLKISTLTVLSIFVIILLMTYSTQRSLFLSRYFIFLIPWILFILALSLNYFETYRNIRIFYILAAVLYSLSFYSLPKAYQNRKSAYRDAFKLILEDPNTFVFTSRSLAFKTPYLEDNGILVEKFDNTETTFQYLIERLNKHGLVWFLDTPIGSLSYFAPLKKKLIDNSLQFEEFILEKENAEPLLLLKVLPSSQEPKDNANAIE